MIDESSPDPARPRSSTTAGPRIGTVGAVVELLRTVDQVMVSFVTALLTGEGIDVAVRPDGESAGEGTQLLVPGDRVDDARRVLVDMGLLENAPG